MVDNKKILLHNVEMAEHANGAAQFLDALFRGKYVTREQAREMADYVLAQTKKNIESNLFATQEQKDAEMHRREHLMRMMKNLMVL
jgi:predicted double-glycine peptidase